MAVDATANEYKQSNIEVVTIPSVENKPTFDQVDRSRTNQQSLLPTSLQNRLLANFISSSNQTYSAAVIQPSTSGTFTFTVRNTKGLRIVAVPDVSVYVGVTSLSEIKFENQWPTPALGGGNFPVYITPNDWGYTDNLNSVTRITCRNNSASPVPALAVVQWRILTQPANNQAR